MATGEWELREEDEYEFDLENPFTSPADEPIASLLDAKGHHAPSVSAAASAVRRDATGFISKVRGATGPPPHSLFLLSGFLVWGFLCFPTRSASNLNPCGAVQVRFGGELAVHPRVAYLALNYVDRFLSKRELPVRTRERLVSFLLRFVREFGLI